jgi:RNA recognition motif-containing protein
MDRDEFRERVYYARRSRSRSHSPGRRSRERYYRDYNSKSRSRSRSPRLRDILRDRSLSHDRSYLRDRYLRYSRSPERRERSREREKPSNGEEPPRKFFSSQYLVHSKDPELMANRLFIGNLPTDRLIEKEIEDIFTQYGKVLGKVFLL